MIGDYYSIQHPEGPGTCTSPKPWSYGTLWKWNLYPDLGVLLFVETILWEDELWKLVLAEKAACGIPLETPGNNTEVAASAVETGLLKQKTVGKFLLNLKQETKSQSGRQEEIMKGQPLLQLGKLFIWGRPFGKDEPLFTRKIGAARTLLHIWKVFSGV